MKTTELPAVQHTPTPWRADQSLGDYRAKKTTFILAGPAKHPEIVASIMHHDVGRADRLTVDPGQREANAAFIVRACNSHEALVAALATARDALAIASNVIAEHLDQSDEETADYENLSAASTQVADTWHLLTSLKLGTH